MKPSPGNGVNLQTHREELVSNGGCGMSDTVTAVQTDTGPGSPMTDKPGAGGDTDAKGIPRRSSIIKDGSRAGRERKKTVSFSSSLSERKISSAADCISAMVRGTELRKVRSNSRVYQRYYLLESSLQALRWEPSKKESDKARIAVSSIREVRTGRNTETFRTNSIYDQISEDCAFSIIYGETYEALDLVANSAEVANVWVTGLRYLILYGKHAMDMIASSEDSLRLVWLAEMFSSKVVSNGLGGREEEGISLRSAVGLIKSVNPGVRSGKVERRFKELHRIKERTRGARTTGVGTDVGAVALPEAMVGTSVVAGAGTGSGDGIEVVGKGDGAGTRTEVVGKGDGAGTRTEVVGKGDGAGTRTEVVGKGDGAGTRTEVVGKGDGAGTRTEVVGKGDGAGTRTEVVGKGNSDNRRGEIEDRVTKEEFIEVFHELCTRPEIYFLLVQFSSNKEFLDTKDLMKFLEAEQGVAQVTEDTSLELIQSHEPSEEGRRQGCLSLDGFTSYLTSMECHLFDPEHSKMCQDMSQPLSHYYINSSHNTYLIEDQFRGPSDITGYIRALKMGCRCVEVDVWDGPDDEPVVYTGYTLTSPVLFRCVLDVIGCFSFAASECPLILCLENHCSPCQQRVMLQHLRRILGERLYTGPIGEGEGYLPSPHALRGKILLKGQKLKEGCGDTEGDVTDEDEGAEMCQRMKAGNSEGGGGEGGQKGGGGGVTSSVKTLTPAPPSKRFHLLKELSDLVTLCKSVRFTDFQKSFSTQKPWEFCSFNETLAVRCASERPGDFVNYNKRFLSRVYPSAMRIDSSNMNPQDLWKCGCQIVAMNYQTPGLMMDLNIAWFRQNGNCGYVLRPTIMRQEVSYFSANTRESVPGVSPQLLHVKVISGQNLPRPCGSGAKGDVVDPYVYVEIHGIPADCAERRTRTVVENGDNPIFDESFEFQINLPELAMVRFVVLDDEFIGDEFIGQYTIPLECLQPGYRHVPLQSLMGEDLPYARLFVHVALTNRRGGGKSHKRGLSVRKARRGREYAALRDLGVKALDDVFKMAAPSLKEATDMRENMQNSVAVFRDLCGVSAVANLMQCVLALGARVSGADGAPLLLFELKEQYPSMESQGPLPDVLRRVVSTYEMMIQASRAVIELSDGVYDRILQIQTTAMEFHDKLKPMAVKEGLKGRKVTRAVESFSWNITILKGQADLLKRAKTEVQENIKQVHYAALTSNLSKGGTGETTHTRRSLDALPSMSGTAPARSFP
ncbi:inactive phospholipase C-like protein 2 isoform X2 [Oncorhynchus mykiss]|uniref:inactive phospholipase C-like protein 2 isoform X2 n=1 Tax=Oncorhynchus mykiss TaxID=8022 RepID=UPI00187869E1|nr:inactive phospholipase C-like protein 2 isoform X2 [Oncorhynchus mykiss]